MALSGGTVVGVKMFEEEAEVEEGAEEGVRDIESKSEFCSATGSI